MWGSCYFNGSRKGISFISLNGRIIHVQSQSSCILALKENPDMVESCLHMAVLLEQRQHVTMWQIPKLSSNWPYPWFLVVHRFLVQTKNYSAFDHQGIYIIYIPIGSMYGIFTYIWVIFRANVGKYSIHGSRGINLPRYLLYNNIDISNEFQWCSTWFTNDIPIVGDPNAGHDDWSIVDVPVLGSCT